jgi:transcriptional regulator with XRE-family HTH domain
MDKEEYALLAQQRFGARVRQIRKSVKPKLTQEALADIAGIDRSYTGKIERGESNVSLVNINRIADALKVEPAELFRDG